MDDKAMQGWLAADPPPPRRTHAPGEEHKWYKMMGAAHLLPSVSTRRWPAMLADLDALPDGDTGEPVSGYLVGLETPADSTPLKPVPPKARAKEQG
jgi:hypothetical protein